MANDQNVTRPKPARINGWKHVFAAGYYSLGGLRRLWHETAFRHEMLLGAAILAILVALGAEPASVVIAAILFLLLIATEALNTSLEVIVDHISADWAEYARDAKDLGSLAVLCLLLANGIYFCFAVYAAYDRPLRQESTIQIIVEPTESGPGHRAARP